MSYQIKCFRVVKIDKPFDREAINNDVSIRNEIIPVDWSSTDEKVLTQQLAYQCTNEYRTLRYDENMCVRSNNLTFFTQETFKDNQGQRYPLTFEQHKSACRDITKTSLDYSEVFDRDTYAFAQKDFNTQPFAVVLLKDNVYLGHIYTWISPVDSSISLAMGIRASIQEIPRKQLGLKTPNIATMLLEGVRRFSVRYHVKQLVVVWPMASMELILNNLQFNQSIIPTTTIGKSISPVTEELLIEMLLDPFNCTRCQALSDINRKLTDVPIDFQVISISLRSR